MFLKWWMGEQQNTSRIPEMLGRFFKFEYNEN